MPQLRTEDMYVLGLRSKFQNVCAYTQTLIHSFIQKQSQRKYYEADTLPTAEVG